jgi:REP element-mobilizing transposase RayT
MPLHGRQTKRLRRGRISLPGARYFVTCCTQNRVPILISSDDGSRLLDVFRDLHEVGDALFCAATVMPDHLHLLFTLGKRLRFAQVLGKLKSLARAHGHVSWRWQENAFERQLRADELFEDFGLYIYMNPYRAGLCSMCERWPLWFCPDPHQLRFMSMLKPDGTPPMEWLAEAERIEARLKTRD